MHVRSITQFYDILQVADFGLSKDLQEGIYYMSRGGKIPVKWTAPEVGSCTMWSARCLLIYLRYPSLGVGCWK